MLKPGRSHRLEICTYAAGECDLEEYGITPLFWCTPVPTSFAGRGRVAAVLRLGEDFGGEALGGGARLPPGARGEARPCAGLLEETLPRGALVVRGPPAGPAAGPGPGG